MNTPIQKAKDRYGKHLEELILHYSTNGLAYSDNQVFLLAQLHNKNLLENENSSKDVDKLDCWYVHYATGNLKYAHIMLNGLHLKEGTKPFVFIN